MTDDIVTRLITEIADSSRDTSMTLLAEAADEIIRWRAEVQRLVSLKDSAKKKSPDLDVLGLLRKYENKDTLKKQAADEIEQLRDEIQRLQEWKELCYEIYNGTMRNPMSFMTNRKYINKFLDMHKADWGRHGRR
jgi:phenylalanyl-tRNA synthetase alpha subunit